MRIEPLTDTILCLTFDEGHIDYFSIGQTRYNGNKVYYGKLNIAAVTNPAGYQITSADDGAYASPQQPVAVGRKAKGVEFHNIYDNSNPPFLLDHWIYLELPQPLQPGARYTLQLDAAENCKSYSFTYDYKALRSPAVHVNQIGFAPTAKKYAYLSHFMGDFNHAPHLNGALDLASFAGKPFHLIDSETLATIYSGVIALQKSKSSADFKTANGFTAANMTRADVFECDFSSVTVPGRYRIAVPGMGCSYPFEIGKNVYREPFNATARATFYQRAGIVQEIEPGLYYPRDHHPDDGIKMYYFPDLNGEDAFDVKKAQGQIDGVWGWYHDAGDWDGYISHFRVPMTLLALYDLKPQNFSDGDIGQAYKLSDVGEGFKKIGQAFGRHINGKAMTLYYDADYKEDDADFEACMPIRKGTNAGDISVRELPGGKCVTLIHKGPYERIGESYKILFDYIQQKGYRTKLPSREVYLKGPGMIFRGNPNNYLTEIQVLIEG